MHSSGWVLIIEYGTAGLMILISYSLIYADGELVNYQILTMYLLYRDDGVSGDHPQADERSVLIAASQAPFSHLRDGDHGAESVGAFDQRDLV